MSPEPDDVYTCMDPLELVNTAKLELMPPITSVPLGMSRFEAAYAIKAPDASFASCSAAIVVNRSYPCKGGDLPSVQAAQFREINDERCREIRTDPRDTAKKQIFIALDGILFYSGLQLRIDSL